MSRIKLAMPEKFEFSTNIAVRITDLNYGSHLGNDALLSLIHEARVQYLAEISLTELDAGGCGIIMTDSVILYKLQVQYGDILTFGISVDDITATGCDFFYEVTNAKTSKTTALAKTGIAFFDYQAKKISPVPDIFLEKVNALKSRQT